MKLRIENPDGPVIPPSAISTMVVYSLFWVWFLWLMCNMKFKVAGEGTSSSLISSEVYWLGTSLCIAQIVWLGIAFARTVKRRDSLRIPHLASIGLGIVLMVSMQYGYQMLSTQHSDSSIEAESLIGTWSEMRARGVHPLWFPHWR